MRYLALTAMLMHGAACAYCEPIHGPDAPTVTLGSTGTETLNKAHDRLLAINGAAGGVILVPHDAPVACDKLYKFTRLANKHASVTIRGVPGPAGERPRFECFDSTGAKGVGTWMSFGKPLYLPNTTTPITDPSSIQIMVEDVDIVGYNVQVLIQAGVGKAVLKNVRHLDGSGTCVKNQELEGDLRLAWEICGGENARCGQGNINHGYYLHGNIEQQDTGHSTVYYGGGWCHDARGSHCFKSTANRNIIVGNLFETGTHWDAPYEPTELLDMMACSNNVVRGNVFRSNSKYGHTAYLLHRHDLDGCPMPRYESPEYQDGSFFAMVRALGTDSASGSAAANPYMKGTFVSGNVFEELGNYAPGYEPMVYGIYGTFPADPPTYYSFYYVQKPVPANWVERSTLYFANNIVVGPYGAPYARQGYPNYNGVPPLPENTGGVVIDLGGNGPAGTQPVWLPSWFKTSE